jgi:DNA-binding GntR family transcriptional regulator
MSTAITHAESPLSLAEQAYHLLEEKLVKLELPPGSMISEGKLIEMSGLGRTPVREALQRLAQQEFFLVMPRKGLQVSPLSRSSMEDVLETRRPLDALIVYRAALNARDEQRSGLSAIAREMSVSHDRHERFFKLDHQLSTLLDECSANPFATAAVSPLRSHCRRFWNFYRDQLHLADAISSLSKMARLVARREFRGAQKASDAYITVLERMMANIHHLT